MWEDKAKVYTLLKDEHLKELYDFLLINNLDFEQFLINNNLKLQLYDIKKGFMANKVFDTRSLKNKLKKFSESAFKKLKRQMRLGCF